MRALYKGSDARMWLRSYCSEKKNSLPEREVTVGGARMLVRRRTSDTHIVDEIFRRKVYGEPPHGTVLDLGANIGAYALYAARTASHVYAFEPETSNFTQLQKNVALNKALPISVFKKAIGGANQSAHLSVGQINKGASSLIFNRSEEKQVVDMITLEHALSLCDLAHVDMVKIDIEGSEYELFDTASMHTLRRIGAIVMEIHHVSGKSYLLL